MGITINGSSAAGNIDLGTNGTITDLAVGGVPDNTIDNGAIADDAIGVAELSATGTASSSTYLRGDNTWATVDTSIADDSIVEAKLDISNAPSDDSILQYKNSSDKLTWVPRGHQILQIQEWFAKSWSTHTGDTGWHGNVINATESKITPTATTSKMAVWGNMHLEIDSNNASTTIVGVAVRVLRKVSGQDDVECYRYNHFINRPEDSGMDTIFLANASFHFCDDPGTTSEVEYHTQTSSHHSSATVNIGSNDHFKGITIMELAE